mmetsp:Transcript_36266/g.66645  ORF Transcript_36266/g.66645 Transcript_36266/m.66645 type:complete len:92 (+) Transcript_36266:923-1198(+)
MTPFPHSLATAMDMASRWDGPHVAHTNLAHFWRSATRSILVARDDGQLVSMVRDSAAHGSSSTDIECGWQGSISEFVRRRSIAPSSSHYLL